MSWFYTQGTSQKCEIKSEASIGTRKRCGNWKEKRLRKTAIHMSSVYLLASYDDASFSPESLVHKMHWCRDMRSLDRQERSVMMSASGAKVEIDR